MKSQAYKSSPELKSVDDKFPLPDLSSVGELEPYDAFKAFFKYAEYAIGQKYVRALSIALYRRLNHELEVKTKNKLIRAFATPKASDLESNRQIVIAHVRRRFEPLLPAIRSYVQTCTKKSALEYRLSWMIDEIENIPGAMEGKEQRMDVCDNQLKLYPRRVEPGIWKELRDGLKELLYCLDSPSNEKAQTLQERRLNWNGTTIEFIRIAQELAARNYITLPDQNGKGDSNVTEYLRRLQLTFRITKDDGSEIRPERLADRWRGKKMSESMHEKFNLPEATIRKGKRTT